MAVLILLEVAIVHVPATVTAVFHRLNMRTPIHLHELGPRLDQTPREQTALAETELSKPPTDRFRFALHVEDLAPPGLRQQ